MKEKSAKPAVKPLPGPENESADPVGDGHSDAELAARTPPGQASPPVEPDRRADQPDDGKGGAQEADSLGVPPH